MKKKGLIISTIVMVVVLIASLTTATYAWFTTDSKATISSISINTASASNVQVGLRTAGATGANLWTDAPSAANFKNGSVGFNGLTVTGSTNSLGSSITSSLNLSGLTKAVGTALRTGTQGNYEYEVDASSFDLATENHVMIAANGSYANSAWSFTNVDEAKPNSTPGAQQSDPPVIGDYVDWVIGFMPTKNNVDTITFNVTVNPGEKPTLGLLAALHLRWSWDGTTYYDVDLYGSDNGQNTIRESVASTHLATGGPEANATFKDLNSATNATIALAASATVTQSATTLGGNSGMITNVTDDTELSAGALNYAITIGTAETALTINKIHQMHFQLYYAGYDVDCVNDGTGAGATIYFTISNTTVTP